MRLVVSHVSSAALFTLVSINTQGSLAFIPSIRGPRSSIRAVDVDHDNRLSMSTLPLEDQDLSPGAVVTKRFLHRFSPSKSDIQSPYAIEERQKFSVAEDMSLEPFGDKTVIIRGGVLKPDEVDPTVASPSHGFIGIGPSMYTVEGLQIDSTELNNPGWTSSYVMALYCTNYPKLISGKGLNVDSEEGVGGILSVIGAGAVSSSLTDQIAPTPEDLTSILMTDSNKDSLDKCVYNLAATEFPEPKVELGLLNWNKKVQGPMQNQFDFVIGSNCATDFESLANVVAHSLKCPTRNEYTGELYDHGSFVHIGPNGCDGVTGLVDALGERYEMETMTKEIVLERIELAPLIAAKVRDLEEEKRVEIESKVGGHIEYADVEITTYSIIFGRHSKDYQEFDQNLFFATEISDENEKNSIEPSGIEDDVTKTLEALSADSALEVTSGADRVLPIYMEWCEKHNKDVDDSRFNIFYENYLKMESLVLEDGNTTMQLHENLDLREDEYLALNTKKVLQNLANAPTEEVIAVGSTTNVHQIRTIKEVEMVQEVSPLFTSGGGTEMEGPPSNVPPKGFGNGKNDGRGTEESLSNAYESLFGKEPDDIDGIVGSAGSRKTGDDAKLAEEVEEFLKAAEKDRIIEAEAIAKATYEAKKAQDEALARTKKASYDQTKKKNAVNSYMRTQSRATEIPVKEKSNPNDEKKSFFDGIIDGAKKIANAAAEANAKAKERARLLQQAEAEVEEDLKQKSLLESGLQIEVTDRERVARVYSIYLEWCNVYGKDVQDSRFRIFLNNFLTMEDMAIKAGKTVQLNKWYDCTEEEYIELSAKEKDKVALNDEDEDEIYADVIDAEVTHAEGLTKEKEGDQLIETQKNLNDEQIIQNLEVEASKQISAIAEMNQRAMLAARLEMDAKGKKFIADQSDKVEDRDVSTDRKELHQRSLLSTRLELEALDRQKGIEDFDEANILAESKVDLVQESTRREREVKAERNQRALLAERLRMEIERQRRIDQIREIYYQWCNVYDKEISENRFQIFMSNFVAMEAIAHRRGESIKLNKWYDHTEEEYNLYLETKSEAETTEMAQEIKTEERKWAAETEMKQRSLLIARLKMEDEAKRKKKSEEAYALHKTNALADKTRARAIEMKQRALLTARLRMESATREKKKDEVLNVYYQWCNVYGKEASDYRFEVFLSNFVSMEAAAKLSGEPIKLNQWFDYTDEEYKVSLEERAEVKTEEETATVAEAESQALLEKEAVLIAEAQAEGLAEAEEEDKIEAEKELKAQEEEEEEAKTEAEEIRIVSEAKVEMKEEVPKVSEVNVEVEEEEVNTEAEDDSTAHEEESNIVSEENAKDFEEEKAKVMAEIQARIAAEALAMAKEEAEMRRKETKVQAGSEGVKTPPLPLHLLRLMTSKSAMKAKEQTREISKASFDAQRKIVAELNQRSILAARLKLETLDKERNESEHFQTETEVENQHVDSVIELNGDISNFGGSTSYLEGLNSGSILPLQSFAHTRPITPSPAFKRPSIPIMNLNSDEVLFEIEGEDVVGLSAEEMRIMERAVEIAVELSVLEASVVLESEVEKLAVDSSLRPTEVQVIEDSMAAKVEATTKEEKYESPVEFSVELRAEKKVEEQINGYTAPSTSYLDQLSSESARSSGQKSKQSNLQLAAETSEQKRPKKGSTFSSPFSSTYSSVVTTTTSSSSAISKTMLNAVEQSVQSQVESMFDESYYEKLAEEMVEEEHKNEEEQ